MSDLFDDTGTNMSSAGHQLSAAIQGAIQCIIDNAVDDGSGLRDVEYVSKNAVNLACMRSASRSDPALRKLMYAANLVDSTRRERGHVSD